MSVIAISHQLMTGLVPQVRAPVLGANLGGRMFRRHSLPKSQGVGLLG